MSRAKKFMRIPVAVAVALAMLMGTITPVNALTPEKESVKYLGSGKVEVEFYEDVDYRNTKVTVKDSSGKSYKTTILMRDDDEIKFKIKSYKKGKKYTFKISGIREEGTRKYGTVSGKVSIPLKSITRTKAKTIAKNHAKDRWGISSYSIHDLEAESETYRGTNVWEVSFESGYYEYEYKIKKSNGKILKYYRSYDD